MNKKLAIKLFSALNLLILLAPVLAFAQQQGVPDVNVNIQQLYQLFVSIMNWIFAFAIVLAVILIIWGGVTYMTAGGDDTKLGAAKKRIIYGLIGVAIVIAAWGLIYLIGSYLGVSLIKPM